MAKTISFWIVTVLFCLAMGAGGVGDLVGAMDEQMTGLGYPWYFARILGFWKVMGVIAVLVPLLPRVKEWAYAGFLVALTGAAASHLMNGDPVTTAIAPIVILGLGVASYALRPESWTVLPAAAR